LEGNVRVEEQVKLALEADRAVVGRSFARATEELGARREALHRSVERWKSDELDLADVADEMLAYEATIDRLRTLQDHLRELRSSAELDRRVGRASAGPSEKAAAPRHPGGRRFKPG
jgi:hypothetical protein